MDRIEILKALPIFKNMSEEELNEIGKIAFLRKFDKNVDIFFEQEMGDAFYIIVSGVIKIYRSSSGGQIKTLALLHRGDFFGEMALLDEEMRSANARVLEIAEIMVINKLDFMNRIKERPQLGMKIVETLSYRIREANKQIEALTFQNVIGRIAMHLLDLAKEYGKEHPKGILIDFDLTHQELADLVGTAREIVTKNLNKLKILRCIEIEDRRVIILNEQGLKELIF